MQACPAQRGSGMSFALAGALTGRGRLGVSARDHDVTGEASVSGPGAILKLGRVEAS